MANELKNFTLTSIKNIQKAIENNKLVIFVGAGVSRNSGIPTWAELIKELAKDLGIKAKGTDSKGNEVFSNDEFLKIPQYYFNERKEKEYYSKVKEVLDKEFQPNEIHKMIFELNPTHIITTNYDNLLEQQANRFQTKRKYCKAANDIELATAPNCNFIIKMHGEFDNIVLKESDYDSYSNNFKLTETYIKGLFATHTILFVGFSADDSNVRRILQWIKDIIGDKHQPAYLIDVNNHNNITEEEFRIKFEYYRNQGIFTLYKTQIENEIEETFNNFKENLSLKGLGKDLYKFLFFIKNYNYFDVNKYYNILKQLECLNIINNSILKKVFNASIPLRLQLGSTSFPLETEQQTFELDTLKLKKVLATPNDFLNNLTLLRYNSLLIQQENKIINQIKQPKNGLDSKQKNELKKVIKSLSKRYSLSNLEKEKVIYIFDIIKKAQEAEQKILIDSHVIHYDFSDISSSLNNNDVNIFKKAFYYYKMNKFAEAFKELEIISKNYLQNPILYYIAEFNKKALAMHLKWNTGFIKYTEEEAHIASEYENINLDFIINNKIPESIKPIMETLTINNVQKSCMDIIDSAEKITNYKMLIENGGTTTENTTHDLYIKLYSFFNFMYGNYLFINNYKQTNDLFYYSIKAILTSYSIEEPDEKSFFDFGLKKVPYFDYFDFYIMIEYFKNKNLKSLISFYEIKNFKLDEGNTELVKNELLISFQNLLKQILKSTNFQFSDKVSNFLTIFGLIDINFTEIEKIVDIYTNFVQQYINKSKDIDCHNYRSSVHKNLAIFIAKISNKFIKQNIELPTSLYEKIIITYKEIWTICVEDYSLLINNCIKALSNIDKYKLKEQGIIDFYIENSYRIECADGILINLFQLADNLHKNRIKKYFKEDKKYTSFTVNNSYDMLEAILNDIIPYTNTTETNLLNITNEVIVQKLNSDRLSDSLNEPILRLINVILDLVLNNKFKNISQLDKLIEKAEQAASKLISNKQNLLDSLKVLKITIQPLTFDYNEANIKDFVYLNDETIEQIKSNREIKNIVLKIFFRDYKQYNGSDAIKEKLINIYNTLLN